MKKKQVILSYAGIALGTFLLALGIVLFLNPAKLSPGGISSLATILYHLFGVKLSITNLVVNGALFLLGFRFLTRATFIRTVVGVLSLSLFFELATLIPVVVIEDQLVSSALGGLLVGAGVGLVIRCGGSTGGSDLAALMLHRLIPYISVPIMIMIIDCTIITVSGIVFKSLSVAFYSVLSLAVSTKVASFVCTVGDTAKSVFILSSEHQAITERILSEFERGVTGIDSHGMYSGKDRLMLLSVVSPKQLPRLVKMVKEIDRHAFIIVSDAREVLGEGFKNTPTA
ncbi:MAG: YitT family protein [Clostridia bacterium]|nr:YitT family protein [Clostridia bacterium]